MWKVDQMIYCFKLVYTTSSNWMKYILLEMQMHDTPHDNFKALDYIKVFFFRQSDLETQQTQP